MTYLSTLGELALGSRFKALSDALYDAADTVYRARGSKLQGRWFPVLRLLHDRGPTAVTEVAAAIGQTHSAVSQLSARLAREGLVRHAADRSDGRRRVLALTPKGEAALRELKPVWHEIRAAVAEWIDGDLMAALARFEARLAQQPIADAILARCAERDRTAVRVVPFEPALREHFYRLNADWLRKYFYLEEIDHAVLSEPEKEILEPGGAILFALVHDEVAGTCALKRESPGVYELTKTAVDERYQGLGLGRRLMEAAIAEFRSRKGRTLFLESSTKLTPALRLYESMGFEHQPTPKPDSHYQRSDVYMIWKAPKAAAPRTAKPARRKARAGQGPG
jgi:ribosomal protein S18 acetylase RimI-like enzyme/DNA-binding transcriptional ArsR family regulator